MNFELFKNEPMSKHTTFRTGGNAEVYYKIYNREGLVEVLDICKDMGVKPLIIGNGSNLLVSDKGISIPVIDLRSAFEEIKIEGNNLYAGAGAVLSKVSTAAYENSLSGLEFAFGIPGTVGGAVYMNAGAYNGEIKDIAVSVDIFRDGKFETVTAEEMSFSYRHSMAMEGDVIIIGVTCGLKKGDKEEIKKMMDDFTERRRSKQPLEYPSAGSTFKRPEGFFAGKLIMDSGLAGKEIGGAMVSPKHCGFIINHNNATSKDVYDLIRYVQDEVYNKFGVRLETEVKLIGEF